MGSIFITYGLTGLLAVAPIYFGSFAGLRRQANANTKDELEPLSAGDAARFPILGSCMLFGIFLVFKYFPAKYVNFVITVYFGLVGLMGLKHLLTSAPLIHKYIPMYWRQDKNPFTIVLKRGSEELVNHVIHLWDIICFMISLITAVLYSKTKHWMLNNIFGEMFALTGIEYVSLDSFRTGFLLLAGLFLYDIFWVFGTNVMVKVATSFDAPIKLLVPRSESPTGSRFALLGLGDIVIPGIFIALCLRFDYFLHKRKEKIEITQGEMSYDFPKPYFHTCLLAYIVGLSTTIVVMHLFQVAQPALLYLSPAGILSVLGVAFSRGQLNDLFSYTSDLVKAEPSKPAKTTRRGVDISKQSSAKLNGRRGRSLSRSTSRTPQASRSRKRSLHPTSR